MQRFHDTPEASTATAPIWDTDTVRDVLARAAQIEANARANAPITAKQLAVMGNDLSLSPDAVQQAIDEQLQFALSTPVITAPATVQEPTRQQILSTLRPLLLEIGVGVLVIPCLYGLLPRLLDEKSTIATIFSFVAWLNIYISFKAGWIAKTNRICILGALFGLALCTFNCLCYIWSPAEGRFSDRLIGEFIPPMVFSIISILLGIQANKLWYALPRNVARRAAANR